MRKSILAKIDSLPATDKMMKMAAADNPVLKKLRYWNNHFTSRTIYARGLYMRCRIQNGILQVAFYLTEHMKSGGRTPAYELYIDYEKRTFLTYDRLHSRWSAAQLHHLSWPNYVYDSKTKWIAKEDEALIGKCLGVSAGGYQSLESYQAQIRNEELLRRHKKETDPWDIDLQQVPKLPKDWLRWVSKVGITENYIYYHYQKNGTRTGYCTFCDKDVPIKNPYHNHEGICSRCRKHIVFKAIGRAGYVVTKQHYIYLLQRCASGFVIREFTGRRRYKKGAFQSPDITYSEVRRIIYDGQSKNPRAYYWGLYKQRDLRWIQSELCSPNWMGNAEGRVYGKTLPTLAKKELAKTGLIEAIDTVGPIDPEKYLTILSVFPQMEKLAKAKLPNLFSECIESYGKIYSECSDKKADSLTKMLGIDKQSLKRLRLHNGGLNYLVWLKHEKKVESPIADKAILWFCKHNVKPSDLQFILNRMTAKQIYHYLKRQMSYHRCSCRDVIIKWRDYLAMAKKLNLDTNDAIIYRVNKLFQRHDELVALSHAEKLSRQAAEILVKFPSVNAICQSIKEKYEYADGDYSVIVPTGLEDILLEGRTLSHCVANNDRYWERIERREAFILFLRRSDNPQKAYYTLEIEPNGTVRQKRTYFDRQEADIEDATLFLKKWQNEIAKRLTAEDKALASKSQSLRNIEFAELRKNRAIIHTGDLAGQLLVDVLMADLLENTA